MAAYVIAEIEVSDPAAYEEYRKQVLPVVTQHGGRLIALRKRASRGKLIIVEGT